MILVLSEDKDYSTNQVLDWIKYFGKSYIRINGSNLITIKEIKITNTEVNVKFEVKLHNGEIIVVDSNEITSYWYRRGFFISKHEDIHIFDKIMQDELNAEIREQERTYLDYLNFYFVNNKRRLGNCEDNATDKLKNLQIAKSIGISIPDTRILGSKKELQEFFLKKGSLISKPASQGSAYGTMSNLNGFTTLVDENFIDDCNDNFFPTLFQECLDKKFELRCFYLNDTIYSMAIFSQNDDKTKVDFRNYNTKKPNRTVPFKLPEEIHYSLVEFMKKINMNCGSIDLIYTTNNRFVFLEVNPVGQFYQLSYPCDYQIEKKIAEYLIQY